MGPLTFSCPETGLAIDAGIDTDEHTFAILRAERFWLRCPHCARDHRFAVAEGRLPDAA